MMRFAKVEGHGDLVRDSETGAIINTNRTEYEKYLSQKESRKKENEKFESLEKEVSVIKDDIDEIKGLLKNFINAIK